MNDKTKKPRGEAAGNEMAAETLTAQQKTTFEAAYKHHLAEAKALPDHAVIPFAGNPDLVLGNVQRGAGVVVGLDGEFLHADIIRALGFKPEQLRAVVVLAQAFSWASLLINRDIASDGTTQALITRVMKHRRRLMTTAEALVESNLLDDAELDPIRPGYGPRDGAKDVTRLVALFRAHAKTIAGKHPIGEADLAQAEEDASDLWMRLNPEEAVQVKKLPEKVQKDIELRDRFFTLLYQRYEQLWKIGAVVWGYDVDEHVPALRARQAGRRAPAAAHETNGGAGQPG